MLISYQHRGDKRELDNLADENENVFESISRNVSHCIVEGLKGHDFRGTFSKFV